MIILGIDLGTTGMKLGIFRAEGNDLTLVRKFSRDYRINTYNNGLFSDIDPMKWIEALHEGCTEMRDLMPDVDVVALSGTTPGLTAMDGNGEALYPAILMLDQRSREQAARIIDTVGLDRLLNETGNMPVAGGCSLASILWIKDNLPDVFDKTHVFGHTNTYIARYLTGAFAIDPSSASLTALYNTSANDLTWNADIAQTFGLTVDRLPELMPSSESPGTVIPSVASSLGLKKEPHVVIGGNDAVVAAYSVGIENSGDIINVDGTCEISLVCLPRCISSQNYNVRAHVLPGKWLTLYVMNAGGKAIEWFRSLFCSDMGDDAFYAEFLPQAIDTWLERESSVTYVPYLMGSRYTQDPLKAEFLGLTRTTTRDELLAALIRGLCYYQKDHLDDIGKKIRLSDRIYLTGGAVNPAIILAKKKWMSDTEYVFEEQSSMKGAAMLGRKFLVEQG